jgi:hypothetical protein
MSDSNVTPTEAMEQMQKVLNGLCEFWNILCVPCIQDSIDAWNCIILPAFLAYKYRLWIGDGKRYRWYAGTHPGRSIKKRII